MSAISEQLRKRAATSRDETLLLNAAEMLEELQAALIGLCGLAEHRPGHLHEYKSAVNAARSAIAKVTGAA